MPLISTDAVGQPAGVAARSCTQRVMPSAPIRRYSTSALLAAGERGVERVVGGPVVGVDGGVPVLHLGVGLGAAEQPVGAGPLEQLLDAAVGMRQREVDVLADDVEQAREALARPRPGALSASSRRRDVGDDAADEHAAVGPAPRAGAIPEDRA